MTLSAQRAVEPIGLTVGLRDDEIKNVVLDLHGVMLRWEKGSSPVSTLVNPKLLDLMVQDPVWHEYELGKLSGYQTYEQLSQKYRVPTENIKSAVRIGIESLVPVPEFVNIINDFRGKVRFFCLTNSPKAELAVSSAKLSEIWNDFERVFIPQDAGSCKPSLNFFKFMIREANLDPKQTVFVDNGFQNCIAARSLGITAIHCEKIDLAVQKLLFYMRSEDERIAAARKYLDRVLESERQDLGTEVRNGPTLSDNFSEFYIAEVLDDERFLPDIPIPKNYELRYSRESDEEMLKWTPFPLPNDLDTTSVAMSVLYRFDKVSFEYIRRVTEHMCEIVSEDGILQTYYDISRKRTCPFVLGNISVIFHYARRPLPPPTLDFLHKVLVTNAFLDGTQYYIGPAPLLFFLSRTARRFRDDHLLKEDFITLLTTRVRENVGTQTDPLACAMMVLACLNLQIEPDVRDLEKVAMAQKPDGSWDNCFFMRANILELGCKALTAAFALSATERTGNFRLTRQYTKWIPAKFRKPLPVKYLHDSEFYCPSIACQESCVKDRDILERQLRDTKAEVLAVEDRARAAESDVEVYKDQVLWYDKCATEDRVALRKNAQSMHEMDVQLRNCYTEIEDLKAWTVQLQSVVKSYDLAFPRRSSSIDGHSGEKRRVLDRLMRPPL